MDADHALRRWRLGQAPRVTLSALADRVDVEPSHLSQIENRIKKPSLALAAKLSRATGIPIEDFVQVEAA